MSTVDITVLVALSVYQLIVSDSLPVSSDGVPVLGQYAVTVILINNILAFSLSYD